MKILYFAFCFLSVQIIAEAKWNNPHSVVKLKSINKEYRDLGNGELATSWAGWKRMNLFSPKLKGQVLRVPTKESTQGFVTAYFFKDPAKGPRPLFVYFPGLFGEYGDKMTDDFIHQLEKMQGHVLVIPNFLSEGRMRYKALYDRDPMKTELYITSAIWKEMGKLLKPTSIAATHIISEGMGGLLALAWSAQQDFRPRPTTVTLLWPPASFNTAINNVDNYLEMARKDMQECGAAQTFPLFLVYFLLSSTPEGISESNGKCLSAWGAHKIYFKNLHRLGGVNAEVSGGHVLRPRNFKFFFEHAFIPMWKAYEKKDESMHLGFWLRIIRNTLPELNVRILTSFDDFYNRGVSLAEVSRRAGMPDGTVTVLDWGGHTGPMGTEEFKDLLELEFSTNY